MSGIYKIIILFIINVFLSSCNSQKLIDVFAIEGYVKSNTMQVDYLKTHNYFVFYPLDSKAHNHIFHSTYFEINIPKGIVNWKQDGNNYFFELENKQLIYLKIPNENYKEKINDWVLNDLDLYSNSSGTIGDYWIENMENRESSFYKNRSSRISKTYTNGKYIISLYNIKKNNFDLFLDTIKSFKVIPRNSL